jgi:glycosyltransferase involved in cell wall biosynthesis
MKILLTSTDNPYITTWGGKHIHLLLLERGLKEIGVEVYTLYYNTNSTIELAKKGMLLLFSEKQKYSRKIKLIIDYLTKHVPNNDFDIAHAHDVLSILAIAKKPQKKVLTLHGYFARENIEFIKNESKRSEIYPLLLEREKEGIKNADHVITVDKRLKDYVISEFNYPEEKVTVMHNAVDTNSFKPISKEEQVKLKQESKLSQKDFVILVPRRLVEKNGVIYAVRAMKNLESKNVTMIIAGDGPERTKIMKEANGDLRVRFIGAIPHDKIAFYYKMSDALVIPSITTHGIQEASSLAMLEGMACGKTVICSSIGGMREIILHMKNGVLTQEKNPTDIAKAIETVVTNRTLALDIGNEARKYAMRSHSYDAHAKKVFNIYRKVLG